LDCRLSEHPTASRAYDPWGKRRNVNGLSDVTDVTDSLTGLTTARG
jgi:hypothetical protein